MNNFIKNINFKKVVIIYIILLILIVSFIMLFLGNVYKDKINLLYNYHKLIEVYDNYKKDKLYDAINNLNKSSNDIIDIVLLNENDIVYTTNNFYKNQLLSINNTNNYYTDSNNNIYKLDTKKEFVLDILNIYKESKQNYYNEFQINYNENNKYTINYLKNDTEGAKIIIISKISYIENSKIYLKIALAILMLFFMMYWIIVTLMIYQNALKLKENAYFWGIITLFTNIFGVIAYLIFIKKRVTCKKCHTNIDISDNYCKNCGKKI